MLVVEEIQNIIKEEKTRQDKLPVQLNLLGSFGSHYENANSSIIQQLLQPNIQYKDQFLKLFLKIVGVDLKDIDLSKVIVEVEHHTHTSRRIDIFIKINENMCIIIENKIYAQDLHHQLYDYYCYAEKENFANIHVLYLTLYGSPASPSSLENLDFNKVKNISYSEDIINWLSKIDLIIGVSKENINLKSAVTQYRYSLSVLTGEEENRDKTQELIVSNIIKYTVFQIQNLLDQQIPELTKINTILKCIGAYKILKEQYSLNISYVFSDYSIDNLREIDSTDLFKNSIPYFSGILIKDKNLALIFLNDGFNQCQIYQIEWDSSLENSIKLVGMKHQNYTNNISEIVGRINIS